MDTSLCIIIMPPVLKRGVFREKIYTHPYYLYAPHAPFSQSRCASEPRARGENSNFACVVFLNLISYELFAIKKWRISELWQNVARFFMPKSQFAEMICSRICLKRCDFCSILECLGSLIENLPNASKKGQLKRIYFSLIGFLAKKILHSETWSVQCMSRKTDILP